MAHLIETVKNVTIEEGVELLERTHALIVERAIQAQRNIGIEKETWGAELKRLEVTLPVGSVLVGKETEKFVEVINMLATTERTIESLTWLAKEYPGARLRECHASTSDEPGGNDIVLVEKETNTVIVRCEVTDVISISAAQNGKEKKDLKNLGCAQSVPEDGVKRFIATSEEFSRALSSTKRKWKQLHYRYLKHQTGSKGNTVMLEVVSA